MKISEALKLKEFEEKKWKEKIIVSCECCNKSLQRTKGALYRASKQGYENIFCSTSCVNKFSSILFLKKINDTGLKICSICKTELTLDKFHKNKANSTGLAKHCKKCTNKFNNEYYANNTNSHKSYVRNRANKEIKLNKEFIINYLNEYSCVDCGEDNILVLDFDHINRKNKKYDISYLIRNAYSIDTIQKEIAKCNVRCSNCHRIKTAKESKNYKWKYLNPDENT